MLHRFGTNRLADPRKPTRLDPHQNHPSTHAPLRSPHETPPESPVQSAADPGPRILVHLIGPRSHRIDRPGKQPEPAGWVPEKWGLSDRERRHQSSAVHVRHQRIGADLRVTRTASHLRGSIRPGAGWKLPDQLQPVFGLQHRSTPVPPLLHLVHAIPHRRLDLVHPTHFLHPDPFDLLRLWAHRTGCRHQHLGEVVEYEQFHLASHWLPRVRRHRNHRFRLLIFVRWHELELGECHCQQRLQALCGPDDPGIPRRGPVGPGPGRLWTLPASAASERVTPPGSLIGDAEPGRGRRGSWLPERQHLLEDPKLPLRVADLGGAGRSSLA